MVVKSEQQQHRNRGGLECKFLSIFWPGISRYHCLKWFKKKNTKRVNQHFMWFWTHKHRIKTHTHTHTHTQRLVVRRHNNECPDQHILLIQHKLFSYGLNSQCHSNPAPIHHSKSKHRWRLSEQTSWQQDSRWCCESEDLNWDQFSSRLYNNYKFSTQWWQGYIHSSELELSLLSSIGEKHGKMLNNGARNWKSWFWAEWM